MESCVNPELMRQPQNCARASWIQCIQSGAAPDMHTLHASRIPFVDASQISGKALKFHGITEKSFAEGEDFDLVIADTWQQFWL